MAVWSTVSRTSRFSCRGSTGVGVSYDFACDPNHAPIMTGTQKTSGKIANRMLHINETSSDLLSKLEAVRLICAESGCAQRYLSHDALNAFFQATKRTDENHGTDYHPRFLAYLHEVQEKDLGHWRCYDGCQGGSLKAAGTTNQSRCLCIYQGTQARRYCYHAGWYSVMSLHGGGSPEAMKREIWRNYPVSDKTDLVERLLDRGVLDQGQKPSKQPGRCCAKGCEVPDRVTAAE